MGWVGLEPTTNALKGRCSTIELPTRQSIIPELVEESRREITEVTSTESRARDDRCSFDGMAEFSRVAGRTTRLPRFITPTHHFSQIGRNIEQ